MFNWVNLTHGACSKDKTPEERPTRGRRRRQHLRRRSKKIFHSDFIKPFSHFASVNTPVSSFNRNSCSYSAVTPQNALGLFYQPLKLKCKLLFPKRRRSARGGRNRKRILTAVKDALEVSRCVTLSKREDAVVK